jgi:hypothetical protein
MKTILAILLAILLGVGLGIGIANLRLQSARWTPTLDDRGDDATSPSANLDQPAPAQAPKP